MSITGHTILTSKALDDAYVEADRRMKASNGHSYITILKTRCQYCGRSPWQKGRCGEWFHTFTDQLRHVLRERHYLSDEQQDVKP